MLSPNVFLRFFALLSFLICVNCKDDRSVDTEMEEMNNNGIALSTDMMGLGNFFGNVFSETVLIHVQSGPKTELQTPDFRTLLGTIDEDNDYFIFNLHQSQTLDATQLDHPLSDAQITAINQQSIDYLSETIDYFSAQNKTVYVFGTGFGGYLVQAYLLQKGQDQADGFLILGSRLDMPELVANSFREGNDGGFINGVTPFTGSPSTLTTLQTNLNKLFGQLATVTFTRELSKYDDLTLLTYGYGTRDAAFGRLTQNERALLITRQAKVLEFEGTHEETVLGLLEEGFSVAFSEEE
ncbi:MAG: hypothetical protein AAF960_15955 [Bacteroidota bacterium]